jgi:hypothetical protein
MTMTSLVYSMTMPSNALSSLIYYLNTLKYAPILGLHNGNAYILVRGPTGARLTCPVKVFSHSVGEKM